VTPGTLVADRFEVERLASSGGMGAVYRATDRVTGELVALKLLHARTVGSAERFLREGRLLAELRHPGIVSYVAHGTARSGELYLAMEWLEGEDLETRLGRGALGAAGAIVLARRVASVLAAAHAAGVIHRDVKPSNVFLVDGDPARAKLIDFGIARLRDGSRTLTQVGTLLGTPGYVAPEQARGDEEVDGRADIFSLGCVLFECLTGQPAFTGNSPMALLAKVLLADAPRLQATSPELSAPLDGLVAAMLAKDKEGRPPSAAAVELALAGIVDLVSAGTAPPSTHRQALTTGEQRLVCVGMVCSGTDGATDGEGRPRRGILGLLQGAVEPLGARVEGLVDGSAVFLGEWKGTVDSQALRAARCALAVLSAAPTVSVALATGRVELSSNLPVGEAIDRAAALVRLERAHAELGVRIDDLTAALLQSRGGFELAAGAGYALLLGERDRGEPSRTLLGKTTPFVGRDRELVLLSGILEECVSDEVARVVLVTGSPGIGKSRLRQEFVRRVGADFGGTQVWYAHADAMSAGSPLAVLGQALRRAMGVPAASSARDDEARRAIEARVARHVPPEDRARVAEFLAEMLRVPFAEDVSVQLRAARQNAVLMADQTRRAWEDFLAAECSAHPVVLLLEDLQWGDLPSVQFVDAALRNLSTKSFMVLALARPEIEATFPRIWAERGVQPLPLGALTRKASERFVEGVLGTRTAIDVGSVVERAGGNPFYLEELVRAAAEGRDDALPDTVIAMVQGRIEALDVEDRRLLRAASVFGETFSSGGLAALLGQEPSAALDERLQSLAQLELLERRDAGSGLAGHRQVSGQAAYAFRHATVREAAYAMLTEADRTLGHRMAREWLVQVGERDSLVLAEHCERAGERRLAVRHFVVATEAALEGSDFDAVPVLVRRAMACGADGEERGALLTMETDAHHWRGDLAAVERCGKEALVAVAQGSRRWWSLLGTVISSAARRADGPGLAAYTRTILEAPDPPFEADADAAVGFALAKLCDHNWRAGNADAVVRGVARLDALVATRAHPGPWLIGWVEEARSTLASLRDDHAQVLKHLVASEGSFLRAGDLRLACVESSYAAWACIVLGFHAEAERRLRALLATADRLGMKLVLGGAKHNLGLLAAQAGRFEEGRSLERQAMDHALGAGDQRLLESCYVYLALIEQRAGDLGEAERILREGLARASPIASRDALWASHLGSLLLEKGQAAEALQLVEGIHGAVERGQPGGDEASETVLRLVYAEALDANGDHARAKVAIRAAADRLLAVAAKISDSAWRMSFLERVPENARTLMLARAWGVSPLDGAS